MGPRLHDTMHWSDQLYDLFDRSPDGTLYGINQAFEEKFGLPPEKTEGENVQSLDIWVDPEDRRTVLDRLDDADPAATIESQLRTASGEVLEVEVSVEEIQQGWTSSLVRAIVDIAEHLGMNVIAEGVETEAQFDRLRELGCQFAQGYRFARPIPSRRT